ncbi:transcription factor S [Candidatus Woesearchaeota archaeon]|nr:transcription factor S [Candidatus Woesearchaeota archaeon]
MFCPKCGSLLRIKKEQDQNILVCSCGFTSTDTSLGRIQEKMKPRTAALDVIEKVTEPFPLANQECPRCKHPRAFFWTQQTRAGDEPETKFFRCEKCKHTWRDYS